MDRSQRFPKVTAFDRSFEKESEIMLCSRRKVTLTNYSLGREVGFDVVFTLVPFDIND
jgi:hypothetical protein